MLVKILTRSWRLTRRIRLDVVEDTSVLEKLDVFGALRLVQEDVAHKGGCWRPRRVVLAVEALDLCKRAKQSVGECA